jgi:hypothetical protein
MPAAVHRPRAALTLLAALLMVWACGGGGSDSTGVTSTPDVAAVIVTGAPATTMLIGESATLVATATNASGGVISGPNVTWKSSAPAVASVTSSGAVKALASGHAVITASVGSHDGTASLDVVDGGTIGAQGGVLTAAGGVVTLSVPAGGVSQQTLIAVRSVPSPVADPRILTSTVFELDPVGSTICGRLTIKFDPAALPVGIAAESLQLYAIQGNAWVIVGGSTVDLATKTVSGTFCTTGSGVGTFAIRSTPVLRIDLAGASANGALFVGQSDQLSASLFGAQNSVLPTRPLNWTSSNPALVSVDATGKVTALGTGSATISVATDGQTTTTTVTVLGRATADWSQATDWTTYQGDSRHSGYINATLDAVAFKELWTKTPGTGNAPSVGGGNLYLSTNNYFQSQTLFALDPATGAQRWRRDFGPIFGLNQPTYYNGNVYVTTGGHEDTFLYSLKQADGSLNYQTAFDSQWEHWKAPVIAGTTIVTAGGYYGGMYGFDIASGAQTFFLSGDQVDNWGPVALNSTVYRTGYSGLTAVNPTDGSVVGTLNDARLTPVITPVIGDANDLLMIANNRLMSIDLGSMQIKWDQSGAYLGMPAVAKGVVYGFSGTVVAARSETDGSLLWSWQPPLPYTVAQPAFTQSIALTNNLLFVSLSGYQNGLPGVTVAIDLASHLTVWTYPLAGDLALSSQGYLFISGGGKVVGIAVK